MFTFDSAPRGHICLSSPGGTSVHMTFFFSLVYRNIGSRLSINISVDACVGTENRVTLLEHVQARLTLSYNRRGNLAIHLISPAGTRSTLLHPRCQHQIHNCANTHTQYTLGKQNVFTLLLLCFFFSQGLMIIRQRVLTTGLSWPPTLGMRTPRGLGHWRLKTLPVKVTTVKYLHCLGGTCWRFFFFHVEFPAHCL